MEYMKDYNISEKDIEELKDKYNEAIIEFLISEKEFIMEKLKYLTERKYLIYPILANNIKIFLEEMKPLKNRIKKMEDRGYSKKTIQMILMNEQLYNEI